MKRMTCERAVLASTAAVAIAPGAAQAKSAGAGAGPPADYIGMTSVIGLV